MSAEEREVWEQYAQLHPPLDTLVVQLLQTQIEKYDSPVLSAMTQAERIEIEQERNLINLTQRER